MDGGLNEGDSLVHLWLAGVVEGLEFRLTCEPKTKGQGLKSRWSSFKGQGFATVKTGKLTRPRQGPCLVCQGLHARLDRALGEGKSPRVAVLGLCQLNLHESIHAMMIRPSARIPLVLAFLTVTLLGASIARAEDTLVLDQQGERFPGHRSPMGRSIRPRPPCSCSPASTAWISPCSTCIRRLPAARAATSLAIELSSGAVTAPLNGESGA